MKTNAMGGITLFVGNFETVQLHGKLADTLEDLQWKAGGDGRKRETKDARARLQPIEDALYALEEFAWENDSTLSTLFCPPDPD